jgi:LmbE family N-acetylglucosaminyl deacetylase
MTDHAPVALADGTAPVGLAPADGPGPLAGNGTPEALWLPWLDGLRLPDMVWPATGTLLVLAPHPDDEVLGVGGIIHDLAALGWTVEVIAVTDGEASHPGSTRHTRQELGALRRSELRAALAALGADPEGVHHLGLPDGHVAHHEGLLRDRLRDLVGAAQDPTLLAHPHLGDGHPDHEAAGRAAAAIGQAPSMACLAYPVWLWHHRRPPLDLAGARVHRLGAATQRCKARAIDCFASQVHPLGDDPADAAILPPSILRRFRRPFEVVFT